MKCQRCKRGQASMQRLALFVDLDECEDGIELFGATAPLCADCTNYVGDEIGRLMGVPFPVETAEAQG